MNRSKKITLISLLAILLTAIIITVTISRYEEKKENIRNSNEIILNISFDSVTALSWEYNGTKLSFHRDECWQWDEDPAFPVDEEKIAELLAPFEGLEADFKIEDVEDYSVYGLNKPTATIKIVANDKNFTIKLGDYSKMDSERYISVGDGSVYLSVNDPLDSYDVELEDLILNDVIPDISGATELVFDGSENYTVTYEEESAKTYCSEDVYFTEELPLDTAKISSYLNTVIGLSTDTYVSYNATAEELEACGLTAPELTITVKYPESSDSDEETEEEQASYSFVLSVGRNQEELAEAAESDEEDAEDNVTAYFRIGESQIIYKLSNYYYKKLMAVSFNELRHDEIVTADFDDVYKMDFVLENEEYSMVSGTDDEDEETVIWDCGSFENVDISKIQNKISALSASEFTDELPTQKEEISFTLYLNNENFPELNVKLYRYNGESCLAELNGNIIALVSRSSVVDLIEAVNAIILGIES